MDAADRLWWGRADASSARTPHGAEPTGAFSLHCQRCGARHKFELQSHAIYWEVDEEWCRRAVIVQRFVLSPDRTVRQYCQGRSTLWPNMAGRALGRMLEDVSQVANCDS